jgi:hypothetical protein
MRSITSNSIYSPIELSSPEISPLFVSFKLIINSVPTNGSSRTTVNPPPSTEYSSSIDAESDYAVVPSISKFRGNLLSYPEISLL